MGSKGGRGGGGCLCEFFFFIFMIDFGGSCKAGHE